MAGTLKESVADDQEEVMLKVGRDVPATKLSDMQKLRIYRKIDELISKEKKTETPQTDRQQDVQQIKTAAQAKTETQQIAELTDTIKRLQADFENHIKRTEKQRHEICEQASAKVLVKMLSIVDDFERAFAQLQKSGVEEKLKEGFALVNKNVHKLLTEEGVTPIECVGKKLDPFRHEVLRTAPKQEVDNDTVIEEHVKGYLLKDKVLRYAKVTIAANGNTPAAGE